MRVSPSRVPKSITSARLLLTALALLAVPAAPASAATVTAKITDAAGDGNGGAALEISSANITQDTTKGTLTATVSFGAAPKAGASLVVAVGSKNGSTCLVGNQGDGSLAFLVALDTPPQGFWVIDGATQPQPITPTLSGSTITLATGAASVLKKFKWDCATVAIQAAGEAEGEVLGDSAASAGATIGAGQTVVQTDKPDGDKDGIPDVSDACPTVPGSSGNGCLTIAANLALRLGAKRVAVDMLVPMTGETCDAIAKATVKEKSKTLGKGTLTVGVHGSFCHISGAVKIKKHGKTVKIKIAGGGFKAISKSLKR